ncbi:MAG: hypothetical protein JOZ69_23580 [Myxococcales bacterium]|nr:hypothetical protein [Myxococcales bacterium]
MLAGSAPPDEHVPFNVLDAAVDTLASVLLGSPLDIELARDLALASEAFPVLGGARTESPGGVAGAAALDALVRLIGSLAGSDGVYLLLDDLERADAASLAFLDRLLARRPGGVGLVAMMAGAGGVRPTRAHAWLDARGEPPRFELGAPADPGSPRLLAHAEDFVAGGALS